MKQVDTAAEKVKIALLEINKAYKSRQITKKRRNWFIHLIKSSLLKFIFDHPDVQVIQYKDWFLNSKPFSNLV